MMQGKKLCELCKYSWCDGKTVCEGCIEGVKPIIKFIDTIVQTDNASFINSKRGCENALQRLSGMKERLSHLSGFGDAFRGVHTDILLKPGDNGPSLPAHRALLARSSVIFKNMFDSDEGIIRAPDPNDQTITMAELSYDELDSLLEFLYRGELPKEKLEQHVRALLIAADKYEITYLVTYCERELLGSLDTTNALDLLEVSSNCPGAESLTSATMDFIVKNIDDIAFTDRYKVFEAKNHRLALQIFRALHSRNKRRDQDLKAKASAHPPSKRPRQVYSASNYRQFLSGLHPGDCEYVS